MSTDQKANPANIDSRASIKQLDDSNMLASIEALANQIEDAWKATKAIQVKIDQPIANVILAGMGGSGLGADVIKNVFKEELAVPFDFVHSYTLPNYVGPNSLVILSSYSGTTEEVLACAQQAIAVKAQVVCIAAGGELQKLAKKHNWPIYLIDPINNPCGQPRMAIGYSVFGTIGLCVQAGLFSLGDDQVLAVQDVIKQQLAQCTVETKREHNSAKLLSYEIVDRRATIIVSEFLEGAAHVAANQSNENAKSLVDYKIVPELNHHLMEGLRFPSSNRSTTMMIFVNSNLYSAKNQKRMAVTQKIVEKNGIDTIAIDLHATTKLAQVFEMITIFSFTSFYLSMLEGIDPSPIPFVDTFKDQLK